MNQPLSKNNVVHYCVPNIASRYSKLLHIGISNILSPFNARTVVLKALFVVIGLKVACISIMVS
jgi:hypothetical protein